MAAIPANAVAITGNLTVVGQQGAGYVTLGPSTGVAPTTSTINFPTKDVRANGVFVSLNGTGKLQAVYRSTPGKKVHILLDVTGYFVVGRVRQRVLLGRAGPLPRHARAHAG